MTDRSRILIVEDNPFDAQIVTRQLVKDGIDADIQVVDREADYRSALQTHPHVIICDHTLPSFDSNRALDILKASGLDIPLIVTSGTIGEDMAVETIRRGACDYLLKDRLGRLGAAVRRALQEADMRRRQRESEAALHESQARLKLALASAGVGSWEWNLRSGQFKGDAQFCQVFGLSKPAYDGHVRDLRSRVHPDTVARVTRQVRRSIVNGGDLYLDVRVPVPDGETRFVSCRGRVLRDGHDRPERLIGISGDVTELRLADQLARERDGLRREVLAWERVLGIVGHELRTPLAGILATAELLLYDMPVVSEQQRQFLETIRDQSLRLTDMVNNMVETARQGSGYAKWNWSLVAIKQACEEAIAMVRPLMDSAAVTLTLDVRPDDLVMHGDADAIRRLVLNLVSNAAKATRRGSITVRCRNVMVSHAPYVQIMVLDTGTGIARDVADKLGEAFALNRGVVGTDPKHGAGLGLAIVRGIVTAHGGTIDFDTRLGVGTTFRVLLRADLKEAVSGSLSAVNQM